MKARYFIVLLALATTLQTVPPARAATTDLFTYAPGDDFKDHELSMDIFGIYATRNRKNFHGDTVGAGVGVNYFLTRNWGLGAETYMDDFDFPNHLDFNGFFRYPLPSLSLAPYVLGGFGRQFRDVSQWTTHIGIGVDFRLNTQTGIFLDVREVFPDTSRDLTLWRLGLRISF